MNSDDTSDQTPDTAVPGESGMEGPEVAGFAKSHLIQAPGGTWQECIIKDCKFTANHKASIVRAGPSPSPGFGGVGFGPGSGSAR